VIFCAVTLFTWLSLNPATIQAQAGPTFPTADISVRADGDREPFSWSVKGAFTLSGIPAGVNSCNVVVEFQKQDANNNWIPLRSQTTIIVQTANGSASNDTGWLSVTNPMPGDKWRIRVTGTYVVPGMPPQDKLVPFKESAVLIPKP